MAKEEKDKGGRPTVITETVVQKLEEAFKYDFTVDEACRYAGIGTRTYYDHYKEDVEFSQKMDSAKDYVLTKAKKNIQVAIDEGDTDLSVKLLRLRQNRVYTERTVSEVNDTEANKKVDKLTEALDKVLGLQNDTKTEPEPTGSNTDNSTSPVQE